GTTMYDMFLQLIQLDDDLSGSIEYSTNLFDRNTIERFTEHFIYLLDSIVGTPSARIGDLSLMNSDDQQQILTRWNDTACDYPRSKTLHQLFAEQAARSPQSPAVSCENDTLSYAELEQRANQLANYLIADGVQTGSLVGVYMDRSVDMMVALLGVLKSGCAYVPLDPAFPASRIEYMMDNAEMPIILTQQDLTAAIGQSAARRISLDSDWAEIAAHPSSAPEERTNTEQLAYVIYTSGSTGQPKGVQISHRAVVNFLWTMMDKPGIRSDDNMLAVTTLSFDIAVLELFMPLMKGAHTILATRETSADGARLAQLIASSKATIMQATPATWQLLLNADWRGNPELKILCGGEALPRVLADRILATGSELWNMYGPTETTIWSSLSRVKPTGPIDIGYPIGNTQMYIVDSNDQPVPVGVAGELCIGGDGLAHGYFKRDELTAEKFVSNPFSASGTRMYRTGDLARYLPDGNIQCLGRNDQQVKVRGYRMELGEIELALSKHSAVREAVVAAREDREGDKRLVGYLIANTSNISSEEIARWKDQQMTQWQDLWQDAYSRQAGAIDPAFDISGWLSSYSGDQIPAEEMRAWIETTTDRINALKPEKVLEIGSGTGLVIARVAPHCKEYTGMDFSPAAIQAVETLRETRVDLKHVRVLQRAANELDDFDAAAYDMVIINSVAQYFPDVEYLLDVMKRAARLVRPGGTLFLGDIRSLALLNDYHTSVQFHQAEDALPVSELAERIQQRMEQEEELLLDPSFFVSLSDSIPKVSGLRLQLKRNRHRNELTRFRYDAFIKIGGSKTPVATPEKLDWNVGTLTLNDIENRLAQITDSGLLINGIPDARLAEEVAVARACEQDEGQTVAELRQTISTQQSGIDVEDLYELADKHALDIQTIGATAGHFNVLLKPVEQASYSDAQLLVQTGNKSLRQYANDPLKGRLQRSLIPMLREQLRDTLPEYMVPSAFMILDKFPLTPNGKIDRNALPEPDQALTQRYVPPGTPTQEALVSIWENVLGANQVGINDDFFELGGHSLLATQLISRIRDTLGVSLPLNALFDFPTVAGLAEPVDTLLWTLNQDDAAGNNDGQLEEVEI
ncbi:MAG: amino acid adenylation domain-containing protein, partial [Gammaproteobacteria bacterium]